MISFIVPVYNAEKKLDRCIQSILNQQEKDIELILVDDGSKDKSGLICDSYRQDSRVKVYHNQNQGVSKTRNFGIDRSSGEYLIFIDSDDFINPNMGRVLRENIERNNSDIVICGYCHWSTIRRVSATPAKTFCGTFDKQEFLQMFSEMYGARLLNSPCNKIYRRGLLREGFRENLHLGEDFLFNLAYFSSAERITIIQDVLYNYVQVEDGGSLSGKFNEEQKQISELTHREAKKFLEENGRGDENSREIDEVFLYDIINCMEKLPYQKGMPWKKKKSVMKSYVEDNYVIAISKKMCLPILEYQMINCVLRWRSIYGIYFLCWWKRVLLVLLERTKRVLCTLKFPKK